MPNRTCSTPGCAKPHRARGLCSTHYNQAHCAPGDRHPKVLVPCSACATPILRGSDPRRDPACSVDCRTLIQHAYLLGASRYDWATDAARRARRLGATEVEIISRDDVLAADGHRCYLCDVDTSLATSPFDPKSATVDHVTPISKGGQHVRANLRCCCLSCNSSKQAHLVSSAA